MKKLAIAILLALFPVTAFGDAGVVGGNLTRGLANALYCQLAGCTMTGTFSTPTLVIRGSTSGTLTITTPAVTGTNTLKLPAGTTDFSATGGSLQIVKQLSVGGAFTVAALVSSEIPNNAANTSGTAATATALAANPTNCSAGNYPLGIDASGNVESCTAAAAFSAAGSGSEIQARSTGSTVQAVTGSSTANGGIGIVNQSAAAVPLSVTGAASQSGDLFQLTANAGTAGGLFKVSSVGLATAVAVSSPGAGAGTERFGASAVASGAGSTAIGSAATTVANTNSVAIGDTAAVTGTASVSIGHGATAGAGGVSIGNAAASGGAAQSIAIGNGAVGGQAGDVAIGQSSSASGAAPGVMVGAVSTRTAVTGSIVIGNGATDAGLGAVAVFGGTSTIATNVYYGKGITNTTATDWTINGTGGSGSNNAGAAGRIAGGKSTGTAAGGNAYLSSAPSGASSSTANTLVDRIIVVAQGKALTSASAVSLFDVPLATLEMAGGYVHACIQATDGTDMQMLCQDISFAVVNKGGSYTKDVELIVSGATPLVTEQQGTKSVSAGTLTATWSLLSGTNKVTMQVTATTSLTTSGTNGFVCYYTVINNSQSAMAPV